MSCLMMAPEPLAALANAVETRLNCGYDFWGFDAPNSLYDELRDCKNIHLYHSEGIYRRLYALNAQVYNSRYKEDGEPVSEEAPVIDVCQYTIHHGPAYREHGFAVRPWHYRLAKLLDFWLYQTAEGWICKNPLHLAMGEFRDSLYYFIVRNSPEYTAGRWGELPTHEAKSESIEASAVSDGQEAGRE